MRAYTRRCHSAATVLLTQTFDPYGNPYASAGTVASAFGFAGEQTDANGLLFLRARYYAPSMGRFLNMDPSRQELNPYKYSGSNPINFIDPTGTSFRWDPPCWPLCRLLELIPLPPILADDRVALQANKPMPTACSS